MDDEGSESEDDCEELREITKEEKNILRIANLLLKYASPVVREKFDNEFIPSGLQICLNMANEKLKSLNKKKVINQKQWNLLFPQTGVPASSTKFDLTLMIVLFKHLSQIKIQDELPTSLDTSLGADLARLKFYRNRLAHIDDGTLTDEKFEQWWDDISQAVIRLGGVSYVQKCDVLKERKLDNNDLEILNALRNIDKSNDPIPKGLKQVQIQTIDEWQKTDESVYETKAMLNLTNQIKKEDLVMVIGPPGCGKTTAVHHCALHLHKEQKYDIVPAINASDIGEYYDQDQKQLFVFDDVCGKYSVELHVLLDWKKHADTIKKIINGKKVKILLTCRSYIFTQFRNVSLLCSAVCDFSSSENVLSFDERFEIAKSHLTEDDAKKVRKMKAFKKYAFFPFLCSFYAKHKPDDIEHFFQSPNNAIGEDLKSFMENEDQTTFIVLSLFVIYNNKITDEVLSRKSDLKRTLDDTYDYFRMSNRLSMQMVKDQLNHLTNSYAKRVGNQYSIIHDKLFDILVCFCGEHMFDFVVELCHADILRDRFQFTTVEDNQEYLITIPVGKEMVYIEQVFKKFTKDDFSTVFENRQMQNEVYRKEIKQFIKNNDDAKRICLSLANEKLSPFFTVVNQGYSDILEMLLDMNYDVNITDDKERTPVFIAAEVGCTDCVELLLRKGADPNIVHQDNKKRTPMYVASKKGHVEIVRLLLNAECNPNQCIDKHKTPLYTASAHGHLETVRLLLSHNADPNIRRTDVLYEDETPLYVASEKGFNNILELLLEYKADPNRCKDIYCENKSPLFKASKKGNTEAVKLLLNYNGDANICRKDNGEYPLHAAASKGHIEIVRLLLSNKADPNVFMTAGSQEGKTPLHIASDNGNIEIVELLLSFNANPNTFQTDKKHLEETPLYIAAKKGNISMVAELLRHKANFIVGSKSPLYAAVTRGNTQIVALLLENKCFDFKDFDKFKQSPLFVASWKGNTKIVELLLKHNFNPDVTNVHGLSPIFVASKLGHEGIVSLLLQYGCNPDICDKYNQSPLFVASRNGHHKIVVNLLKHKSDPLLCNVNGFSSLTISLLNATRGMQKEIVMSLLEHCATEKKITKRECSLLIAILSHDHKVPDRDINEHSYFCLVLGGMVSSLFVASCCNNKLVLELILQRMEQQSALNNKAIFPALLAACRNGFVEVVRILLKYRADPNGYVETEIRPLCLAAGYGHINNAEMLMKYSCDFDLCDKDDSSPLYLATVINHEDIVKLLLQNNCNINLSNKMKRTPLYIASLLNHTNIVNLLLEYNCDINTCDINNQSPLFVATQMNHTETVKLLLDGSCDCNLVDKYQQSPLHIATENLNVDIVRLLLEHNCNPNLCDKYNRTALCVVLEYVSQVYVIYLDDLYDKIRQIVILLLEHNIDTNLCNNKKESPLHLCIQQEDNCKYIEMIRLILQHNCNPNLQNMKGQTALYLALKRPRLFDSYVVQMLLDGNADPNIVDAENRTPLHVASKNKNERTVKLLLQRNNDIDKRDYKRRTPLYMASIKGRSGVLKTLLEHKANPDLCDDNSCSPLYIACIEGGTDIVEILLKHKANPDLCDEDYCTPLFMAAKHGHFDIVKLLIQYKCNPFICNKDGILPWLVAMEWGHADISDYLLSISED